MRIHAAQQYGARGRATRVRVEVCEAHAFPGQVVEVRRLDLAAERAQVGEAEVVAEDDDDVRSLGWSLCLSGSVRGEQRRVKARDQGDGDSGNVEIRHEDLSCLGCAEVPDGHTGPDPGPGIDDGQPAPGVATVKSPVVCSSLAIGIPQNETSMGQSTTSAHPAVTVVDISDLAAANAGMDLIELDGMSLQSLPLQAKRVIVRLDSATIVYHFTNLRLRTRTKTQKGLLAYVTFGPRT